MLIVDELGYVLRITSQVPPAAMSFSHNFVSTKAYVPRWGVWLAAHLSERKAWAIYRERQKRFASLIGGLLFRSQDEIGEPGAGHALRDRSRLARAVSEANAGSPAR